MSLGNRVKKHGQDVKQITPTEFIYANSNLFKKRIRMARIKMAINVDH